MIIYKTDKNPYLLIESIDDKKESDNIINSIRPAKRKGK